MLQRKCPSLTCSQFDANNILNITFQNTYKEGIIIWCANGFKRHCYPILVGLIVDYEEQVLITGIKANI